MPRLVHSVRAGVARRSGPASRVAVALAIVVAAPGLLALPAGADPAPPASAEAERPRLLVRVPPVYPPEAIAAHLEADVTVEIDLDATGAVTGVSLVKPAGHGFDEAALAAVRQYRFSPARVGGEAVPSRLEYVVRFRLQRRVVPASAPASQATSSAAAGSQPVVTAASQPAVSAASQPVASAASQPAASVPASVMAVLRGTLREKGTREPIAEASVVATPVGRPGAPVETTTDDAGAFVLDLPSAGRWRVNLASPAHATLSPVEDLGRRQELAVIYYAERTGFSGYRTVVHVHPAREEVSRTSLDEQEILYIPGTNGDAIRSVTNLPGLARPPFNTGFLIIEGSGPADSAVFIGGGTVQQLFHFEALSSTFNSNIIQQIDYLPSNFSVRYGRVTGGIVDVEPKPGRRDGYHGYGDANLIDVSGLVQGPLGPGSFAVGARRSTVDLWLPYVLRRTSAQLSVAPYYYDYQGEITEPFLGGTANVLLYGSEDQVSLVFQSNEDIDAATARHFDTDLYFHYLQPSWDYQRGPLSIHLMAQTGPELQRFNAGPRDIDQSFWNTSGRAELAYKLSRMVKLEAGLDIYDTYFHVNLDLPKIPTRGGLGGGGGFDALPVQHVNESPDFFQPAVWEQLDFEPIPGLLLMPGTRVDYHSYLNAWSIDPRFAFRWTIRKGTTLKGGLGIFHEAPQPWFYIDRYLGNPDLPFEKAVQASLGVEQELPGGYYFDVTPFYKVLSDLPFDTPSLLATSGGGLVAQNYAPTQTGKDYGVQVLARKQLTDRWFGWIAYTLSKTTRQDAPGTPVYPYTFDQTHILTLIASYKITRKWQLGTRVLYSTGNTSTPVIGATFNVDHDTYVPILGATNAFRTPAYFQIDLRLDRRFTFDTWVLDAYIDVQNATNRANVEGFTYNYNYTQRNDISGLPILPSLGVRGDF